LDESEGDPVGADVATGGFGLKPSGFVEPFPFAGDPLPERDEAGETSLSKDDLLAEADELMAADDYWRSRGKQARVAAIFRHLYPGTIRTAPIDFGEAV